MRAAYLIAFERFESDGADPHCSHAIAEWFDRVPDLMLLLLGANPRSGLWPVLEDQPQRMALWTSMPEALQRLERLRTLVRSAHPLESLLEAVTGHLKACKHPHLLLDYADLLPEEIRGRPSSKPAKAFLRSLQTRAQMLESDLQRAQTTSTPLPDLPSLQALLNQPEAELGYWGEAVDVGYWTSEGSDPEWLKVLRAQCNAEEEFNFRPELRAYVFERLREGIGPEVAVVTDYGRWLLPWTPGSASISSGFDDNERCWISLKLPASAGAPAQRVLLDSNGLRQPAGPCADIYPLNDNLALLCPLEMAGAQPPTYQLMHLGRRELLPGLFGGQTGQRLGEALMALEDLTATDPEARIGLMDAEGRRLGAAVYRAIGQFHAKHRVAMARGHEGVGLLDASGELRLPARFDRLGCKIGDVPHIHGDRLLVYTAQRGADGHIVHSSERVGIADTQGRVIVEPQDWRPWHLQFSFDREGRMLVHDGEWMRHLHADGRVGPVLQPLEEAMEAIRARFRSVDTEEVSQDLATLAADVDRLALAELLRMLCRGQSETAESLVDFMHQLLDSAAEPGEGDEQELASWPSDRGPAAPFFRALAYELRDQQIWMQLDWKAVDEVPLAYAHLPDLPCLRNFEWGGCEIGEDMQDGLLALDEFLQNQGMRLISFETDGDHYLVGPVRQADYEDSLALARCLGVPLSEPSRTATII
ncbi:MAG: hypothetical protein U1E77_11745 [Inhella sp.]